MMGSMRETFSGKERALMQYFEKNNVADEYVKNLGWDIRAYY